MLAVYKDFQKYLLYIQRESITMTSHQRYSPQCLTHCEPTYIVKPANPVPGWRRYGAWTLYVLA